MTRYFMLLGVLLIWGVTIVTHAEPQWLKLPVTPSLPKAEHSGYASINGVQIWYATYGHGQPVILLHGGLGNSSYWGNQVPILAQHYRVIVMDSRGHGRSTRNEQSFSYDLMTSDVLGLLDFLKIKKVAIIGWSDGAIIGLLIAIHHPSRLTKLFAYAANSNPSGIKADIFKSSVFKNYVARTKNEYKALSSTPKDYKILFVQLSKMSASQPHFTKAQLKAITIPVWIVDGDHDEVVKRENTEFMAAQIPDSGFLLQPLVSHFSFLQDPKQFNNDVLNFLEKNQN
ncbi:lipolytic enzyme [Legionella moravica]|uniref:Lipolytic enzyme n=1 Tax=Legionella moravica TaxID=39962 RepID=A0A378JTA0_9GAMM|nr:alpha/beta hydrolase [Legionella moravica]KTD37621.1 lipolytic enzyme [Legionella moravica]STX61686.1 lipolytic protein [Legionella moravica]